MTTSALSRKTPGNNPAGKPGNKPAPQGARRKPFNWRRAGAWTLVVVAIIITVAPFLWMLRTALSSNASLASNASNLLPADFSLGAFKRVLGLQTPEEAIAEGGSGA
ncbi:MAG: hypothetical protein Q7T08_13285, partial [Devosia sp.]|nr:hypothetical protein [Devosia sp.]